MAAPLNTLLATRAGHGEEAADLAVHELARINGTEQMGFFKILMKEKPEIGPAGDNDALFDAQCAALRNKKPAMSKVSMSWWLSASVQAELDAQFCDAANRGSIEDIVKYVGGRYVSPCERSPGWAGAGGQRPGRAYRYARWIRVPLLHGLGRAPRWGQPRSRRRRC